MSDSTYRVLLSRALPGAYSSDDIDWHVSVARGWAEIHPARILDGTAMIWPQLNASPLGRWLLKLRTSIERNRDERTS